MSRPYPLTRDRPAASDCLARPCARMKPLVALALAVILPFVLPFLFVFKTQIEYSYHPWAWPAQGFPSERFRPRRLFRPVRSGGGRAII